MYSHFRTLHLCSSWYILLHSWWKLKNSTFGFFSSLACCISMQLAFLAVYCAIFQYIWLLQQFSVLHFNAIGFSCSLVCYISVHLGFVAIYCATFQCNWLFLQFYTFQCICRIVHLTRSPLTVTRCEQSTPLSCNNSILVETFYKNSEKVGRLDLLQKTIKQ